MKKTIGILVALFMCLSVQNVQAESINKAILDSEINKGSIAISIKDINSGKSVYQLNQNVPMHPASTQKIITYPASLNTLGKDYKFNTALYKNNKNELFLKLGADPYLTFRDLKGMMKMAKSKKVIEPKTIFIDDYILDSTEWGEGWQWDDDLNVLMPKFSSYNIDKNLLTIYIRPTAQGTPATIITDVFYPLTFMNLVTTDKVNKVSISRDTDIAPDVLKVEGTVNTQITKQIPLRHPKRYFMFRLEDALKSAKIDYYVKFKQTKLPPSGIYLVDEVSHTIEDATNDVLKQSNNYVAETVFKIAGGKYVNNTGSLINSQKMLNDYLKNLGLNSDNIRIVDGSGVSKNNLMTADFMTEFLLKQAKSEGFKEFELMLPTAGEGTLNNRMLYFKNNLYAKTGTLSDISAITGYLTSKSGKTYVFNIMINDAKTDSSDKKMLEEYILRALYNCY